MGMMIGTMLLVAGLIMCVGAVVQAAERRRTKWWARHRHEHRWRAIRSVYAGEETVVVEECRRCPALQMRRLAGAWIVNRIGELSPVEEATEAAEFERMLR